MSHHQAPETIYRASAPGRLDVMGGIADYSGSLVLQMPIREETHVQIILRDDFRCVIQSETPRGGRLVASVDYPVFLKEGRADYDFAQSQFKKKPEEAWIAYVLGCAICLQKERNIAFRGADITIRSEVPLGKGVSSSASLEVATMKALVKAYRLSLTGTELPRLAQWVENFVVGAPCGLMDQLTSFFGEKRKLLPIVCQPDDIKEMIPLPSDVSFIGIDSGIRHEVSGSSYADVRCAAFMGYSIIGQALGVSSGDVQEAVRRNDLSQLPYGGYLCNIPVAEFEKFKPLLPLVLSGKDFLSNHARTIDSVTAVNPKTRYSVYECTAHPVYENERVHDFMKHLLSLEGLNEESAKQSTINRMGELMYASHASYSRCGLGSPRTDEIVSLAREKSGIAGAKITGGGSGGTVCLLAAGQAGKDAAKELHHHLENLYNTRLSLFET